MKVRCQFDLEARHIVRDALFLDIPYIVDSFCRHTEYRLNRLHTPRIGGAPQPKSCLWLPSLVMFVVVLAFAAYGPTLHSLCALLGRATTETLTRGFGRLLIVLAVVQFFGSLAYFHFRIRRRFDRRGVPAGLRCARSIVVHAVFAVVLLVSAAPLGFFGQAVLATTALDTCVPQAAPWPAAVQAAALVLAAIVGAWRSCRAANLRRRIAWQAASLAALVLLLAWLPGISLRTEAAQVPYPHVFGVVAVGAALIAWLATWLVAIPFRSVKSADRAAVQLALRSVELFPPSRDDPPLSPRRIFGGLVIGILQKPMQFVLLPAFAVLLVTEGWLWHAAVAGVSASALLTIAGTLTSRWDRMAQYLRRYFLLGTPLVVSVAVIVVAALRLAGVQYVTTLLDVAPFGVLFAWMVMAYTLSWWFEYQVNSLVTARLLGLFDPTIGRDDALVPYEPDALAPRERSRVDLGHRYLTGHGLGELIVVGQLLEHSSGKRIPAFHAYTLVEFFETLLARSAPDTAREILRRVQLYFALVNVLLVLGLAVLAWHWGRGDRTNTVSPVVRAGTLSPAQAPAPGYADLAALLAQDEARSKPSALVVAASGGGTRAALYTASVLRGLHELGADSRIVLLSGVSGGGVAAAYFYGHRSALVAGERERCDGVDKPDSTSWDCFLDRMAMPFIGDVLRGASEWRIQSEQPLGVLLAESFERRLFAARAGSGTPLKLGADANVGLVLNTTVSGHPVQDAPALDGTLVRLPATNAGACQNEERPVSALAGGRLAFSNLRHVAAFERSDDTTPAIRMPFVVVRDRSVGLAQAAALNANFPPVFPNARVDLHGFRNAGTACDVRSYFVTDGGATENLGLLSALMALHSALDAAPGATPRDIDLVLAEASAFGFDYAQDRGVGAATGEAKERLTGGLALELLARLRERLEPAQLRVHDLSMPRVFRSRGGFGTHWMHPGSVTLDNPQITPVPSSWTRAVAQFSRLDRHWVTLDRAQLFTLWNALYDTQVPFCSRRWENDPHQDFDSVSRWICGRDGEGKTVARPDPQTARWQALKQVVRASPPRAP